MKAFIVMLLLCAGIWYLIKKDEDYERAHPVDYSEVNDITASFTKMPESVKDCKVYAMVDATGHNRITLVKCPKNDVETVMTPVLKQSDKVQVTVH